ncbi:MAG: hypothetical protein Q9163_000643 [Psora crenata]
MSKRKSSQNPSPASQGLSIFLTNLRLLDLDKRDDWPSISVQILASKDAGPNQKARIQCVEWALYRLFECWNPEEAKGVRYIERQKLLPFFPPLEPLQSLNLRAALYRCLNNLKQDGTLGKEVILRKTMFDSCNGEKFSELLVAFSALVLRKVSAVDRTGTESIAGRMCLAEKVPDREYASLLPLAVAHRVALKSLLRRKAELGARYRGFRQVLDVKDQELSKKFDMVVERQEFLDQNIASEATVSRVAKLFNQHWQGDQRYIDVIAQGEESALKDGLLDRPFEEHWHKLAKGTSVVDTGTSRYGLVQDLDGRIAAQKERLQHWQNFKREMRKNPKTTSPSKKQISKHLSKDVAFDLRKEKDLVFSPRKSPRKSVGPSNDSTEEQAPATPLATGPEQSHSLGDSIRIGGDEENAIQTAIGGFGDRKRSYFEYPALENSALDEDNDSGFSEINNRTLTMAVPNIQNDVQVSTHSNTVRHPEAIDMFKQSSFQGDEPFLNSDSAPSQQLHQVLHEDGSRDEHSPRTSSVNGQIKECNGSPEDGYANGAESHFVSEEEQLAEHILSMALNAGPTPLKPSISLSERTRQSMAFASPGARLTTDTLSLKPSAPVPNPSDQATDAAPNLKASLVERTRQSISLIPSKPKPSRKSMMHNHRNSRIYPINPFETPRTQGVITDLTPPEELLDPGAGYDSVFKSRPKVAFSPTASPEPVMDAVDDGPDDDEAGNTLASSPLATKGLVLAITTPAFRSLA